MKFQDFHYQRPDMEKYVSEFRSLLNRFSSATSAEAQNEALAAINRLRAEFSTMDNIAHVRHTINTKDPFYEAESTFFDEAGPTAQGLVSDYYRALVNSPFRAELETKWGSHLFALADAEIRTFSPEIVEELQQENKLASDYVKLLASASIEFDGGTYNLSQIVAFVESADRDVRKRASEARWAFYRDNEEKLDEVYDKLVKVRTSIAKKLGYDSFVGLAYDRLNRTDYDAAKVANFRKQVREQLVPFVTGLWERQRARIGVEKLMYYDMDYYFPSGNAHPKGGVEWQLERGAKMYKELSKETDEFFRFMLDNNLMDLESKPGKAGGGYCTYFQLHNAPFIFANYNGTAHDVTVLTHEAGHAFQVYNSMGYEVPEYHWPTLEACEIHSMSMEFFTWPWMDLFFEADTEKFKYYHVVHSLQFIPYGVTVDEFQHWVYENPEATPAERKAKWRELERVYLPHRNYEGNDFLERGGYWQFQRHIYRSPFYYIDYTLAQICAFQFWKRTMENREAAWSDYVKLCRTGGSKPFTELVKEAGLVSPFEDGCIASVIEAARSYLAGVDDSAL
ncbi:M3 family oligoendopeptidase [Paenibacillus thermotolerans]|uniref:M3 family oligoendopeptidase n=1 Tax=Paenibacillus thermotolerans TaxID=3027807 RepID=UPI00236859A3|nr:MULTISPECIES: M3 family oligoendopeptidase [unclassified Paenibacillus]